MPNLFQRLFKLGGRPEFYGNIISLVNPDPNQLQIFIQTIINSPMVNSIKVEQIGYTLYIGTLNPGISNSLHNYLIHNPQTRNIPFLYFFNRNNVGSWIIENNVNPSSRLELERIFNWKII